MMSKNNVSLIFDQPTPKRLDIFMSEYKPELSRSFIAKQIINGNILVNAKPSKVSHKLHINDLIEFNEDVLEISQPENIKLPIIYEDDFCIVINKPSGLITHTKGNTSSEASIASFIYSKLNDEMIGNRAGIVHRLDRGTSGVIVAAKTPFAVKYLQRQFAKRQVIKTYIAIVSGSLEKKEAIINMSIERNPKHPSTFRVGHNGKSAETQYQVIAENKEYSLLKLTPKTGRTHQLRVHLKAIDHPIVGDEFYGGLNYDRLMLHAYTLVLTLPDKGKVSFLAPLPKEFSELISIPSKI